MKKKKKMVWMVILSLILFLNLLMHFVSSCNITLNYLSTALAAFSLGLYLATPVEEE